MKRIHWLVFGYLFCYVLDVRAQICEETYIIETAQSLIKRGEFQLANDTLNFGMNCLRDTTVSLLLLKYEAQRNRRKTKSAVKLALLAKRIQQKNQLKEFRLPVNLALAEIFTIRKKQNESEKYFNRVRGYIKDKALNPAVLGRVKYIEGLRQLIFKEEIGKGIKLYQEALQVLGSTSGESIYLRGQILRALGNRTRVSGDYAASLRYNEEEIALYVKHYAPDQADIAIAHYNAGSALYEMHEYQTALEHYLLCYEVWKVDFDHNSRYYRFLTEAIGDMYWELNQRESALSFYNLSTANESIENRDSSIQMAQQGDSLLIDGNYQQAIGYFQQALSFRERSFGRTHPLTVACQNFVGRAYQSAGKNDQALEAFDQSLLMLASEEPQLTSQVNSKSIMTSNSMEYMMEALSGKGELLLQKASLNESFDTLLIASKVLSEAVRYMDHFRYSPMSDASKYFWNRKCISLLENAIRTELLLFKLTDSTQYIKKAFHLSEKSRSFLLRSALQSDQAMHYAGVSKEVILKEQELRRQVLYYDNKVLNEEKRCSAIRAKQLELWKEKQTSLYRAYSLLIEDIKAAYPQYFNLKYHSPDVDINILQNTLGQEKTAIVEFFEGDQKVYIFYVDLLQLKCFEIEKDSLLTNCIIGLKEYLSNRNKTLRKPNESYHDYIQNASILYKKVLADVLSECTDETKRLIIIPSESFANISFAALLKDEVPKGKRIYKELPYLFKDYAISYTSSTQIWLETFQSATKNGSSSAYVGFAPDYKDATYDEIERPPLLLYSQKEVKQANQIFSGKTYLGSKATEHAFRKQSADLLHIAAHVWLDETAPLLSKLILLPEDTLEDGLLHAYEIYGMNFPTQLTILSACHSATGQFEKGEGIMSLERAFQYAGCPSLLSSMWSADDEAASILTQMFLTELKNGEPKDVALQKAQLEFLNQADPAMAIPFYWAGFRLAGNTSALQEYKLNKWPFILGVGVCLIALILRRRLQLF